jgi:hypothetical protein
MLFNNTVNCQYYRASNFHIRDLRFILNGPLKNIKSKFHLSLAFTCLVPAVSWSTIQSKCPLCDDVLSFKQEEHIFNGALSC